MSPMVMMLLTLLATLLVMVAGFFILLSLTYRKAPEGFALIRNGAGGPRVSTTAMMVIPVLHKCDLLGIMVQQIDHSVVLKDKEMKDFPVTISLYVKPNTMDETELLMVHQKVGADGMAQGGAVSNTLRDMAEQAVAQVTGRFTSEEIHQRSFELKHEMIQLMGYEFEGFLLEDLFVKPAVS